MAPGPPPLRPAMETMFTITPLLRSIIDCTTACEHSTALVRLSRKMSSHLAAVISRIFMRSTSEPALLIRISMGPSFATVVSTMARIPLSSRTSAWMASAPVADATFSAPSRLR